MVAVLCAAGVTTAVHAGERATPREARAMFEQAGGYMEQNGAAAAFSAFNDRTGKFVRKDLYV
ncbi:MAG TPA: chemotaxis protein, partial [Thauera sp.]|nr:chemotaxis protein [Thauera sp.]